MRYYCHLATSGDVDSTNLQLYSLQQAVRCWNELIEDRAHYSSANDIPYYTERLAFILSCLGLSLTQLLGQNIPSREKKMMAPAGELLTALLARAAVDRAMRSELNSEFRDFLSFYNAIRHFDDGGDGEKHRKLDKLTISDLDRFRQMTVQIWDVAIAMYRKDGESEIHIEAISEVVRLDEP